MMQFLTGILCTAVTISAWMLLPKTSPIPPIVSGIIVVVAYTMGMWDAHRTYKKLMRDR